jgi:hypothetical protein
MMQAAEAIRRWGPAVIVTFAATAALTALSADAGPVRRAAPTEATAPRDAGEPIMAIVSIKSQQVTFYDADGWILRAPVSTGVKGRETPRRGGGHRGCERSARGREERQPVAIRRIKQTGARIGRSNRSRSWPLCIFRLSTPTGRTPFTWAPTPSGMF